MAWSVYMHTCPNGKRYIGITSKAPEKRWSKGLGYHNQVFYQAIKKYGWDNIEHEIITVVDTVEEAVQLEAEYIAKYDTTSRWRGYNVSPSSIACGGLPQPRHSEATRKKMSESAKRRPPRIMTPEILEKLKANRAKIDLHAPKHLTKEGRIKSIRSKARVVVQYDKDWKPIAIFESAKQAWDCTKINPCQVLSNQANFAGGFRWKHADKATKEELRDFYRLNTPIHLLTGEIVTLNIAGV